MLRRNITYMPAPGEPDPILERAFLIRFTLSNNAKPKAFTPGRSQWNSGPHVTLGGSEGQEHLVNI
jgi:hypothetical protein